MHPVKQGLLKALQFLGSADIGQNHELFDQLVRLKPFLEIDRQHLARVRQHDPPFRQIKVQRLPRRAGLFGGLISGVKRFQHRLQQRGGLVIRRPVHRRLHLRIMQRPGRPHHPPHETVGNLVPLRIQPHPHGKAGAVHMLMQAAQITRKDIGQHRHHPVGEIGRIAAPSRLAVKRRAGGDIMGHIGNGDPDDVAAVIARLAVGFGIAGVIAVAGVNRVNGDQRQVAQIGAARQTHHLIGAVSLGNHGIGKLVGNAVLMNGNQADGARPGGVAQPGGDPRLRQTHLAAVSHRLCLDQLAVAGLHRQVTRNAPFLVLPLVDGHDPAAFGPGTKHAQHLERVGPDPPDQPRLILVIIQINLGQPRQNPVTAAQRRITLLGDDQNTQSLFHPLFQRTGIKVTRGIGRQHQKHRYRRQFPGRTETAGRLLQRAFPLQFGQKPLEVNPRVTLDPEGFGNVTLGRKAGVLGDPLTDLLFGGQWVHGPDLARRTRQENVPHFILAQISPAERPASAKVASGGDI